ncbi:MAG: phosphodiester glycosidase family protein [Clostridia bacterium]|nr:phosphodiester glycosidase family protein [Clostridia bacterium]
MNKFKGWVSAVCVLMLLAANCVAESTEPTAGESAPMTVSVTVPAEKETALPIDFSGGMEPIEANFVEDKNSWSYEDPTISVTIETGRTKGNMGCDYWIATIKIQDPSQLRTASKSGFDRSDHVKGTTLAKRMNAVLAINGDYYSYTAKPFVLRQGQMFVNLLDGERDILLIDEDGDFHGLKLPQKEDITGVEAEGETVYEIEGKRIINAFNFGPILVLDGKVYEKMALRADMAAKDRKQRMAIAQSGPLEYKCICCGPPARGSYGMTLMDFAKLVAKQNVQIAYNLDGGDSTMMIFNGKKINDKKNKSTRDIVDIIYFASAYEGN